MRMTRSARSLRLHHASPPRCQAKKKQLQQSTKLRVEKWLRSKQQQAAKQAAKGAGRLATTVAGFVLDMSQLLADAKKEIDGNALSILRTVLVIDVRWGSSLGGTLTSHRQQQSMDKRLRQRWGPSVVADCLYLVLLDRVRFGSDAKVEADLVGLSRPDLVHELAEVLEIARRDDAQALLKVLARGAKGESVAARLLRLQRGVEDALDVAAFRDLGRGDFLAFIGSLHDGEMEAALRQRIDAFLLGSRQTADEDPILAEAPLLASHALTEVVGDNYDADGGEAARRAPTAIEREQLVSCMLKSMAWWRLLGWSRLDL